ncbi:hypothetical protein CIPAW_08G175400 [Carya illinoinensis]|uniref:AAA+ ATPase domain-containing protein n=1 Tax=Carya illinoinensis TaxID=32201 RepID=A0A8T1PZL0_CARIL|nr:hypothetical protein CIPAW_08G175400 [Carya illinoinensis]
MENLKNQKEKLQHARERVQQSVDAAFRNGEEIYPDVSKWLIDVDRITELATTKLSKIEEEAGMGSSNAACQNSEQRHQLSREAKEIVENIAELLENGNFNGVSYRPALQEMETPINMDYMAMKSRMAVVEGIMEALRSADIYKIGVWGMPGIGKSTLMKEIARQAREEGLFDEVVETLVTNSPVIRKIQGAIASMLGLNFDQETDELGRASQLQRRLSKDKKILVILDDIWKELDLQKIGIPSERCKVVMTSRDRDVLICGMGTQKEIELKILQKEDAWNLFEMRAGEIVRNPKVSGIAIEIVEKCAGLPIALVTVSKALKNKNLSEWKDALRRLKRPAPEHVTEMLKTIYSPIELSYDNLESRELKSLFLLCAQLSNFLHYRDLLIYSYGYGLFHGINTLEEARDALHTLLRKLKDSCLLLENSNGFCMHDLVRDVATIIASRDCNMFVMRDDGGLKVWSDVDALKRCKAISIFYGDFDDQLPNEMECPELIFLFIDSKVSSLQIPDTLFQGMKMLKVLDLTGMLLSSLPSSLFFLRNLQTLCLDNCALEDISGIGELQKLVVLSLLHSKISKLPREIGSLVRLQLLDLSHCSKLEMIPPNVISSLVKLEELYMGNSVVQWEVEGLNDERKNASLVELKHLSKLNTLEIQIQDVSKLQKDLNFEKLERYKICIGDVWHWSDRVQSSRTLKLKMMNSSIQSEFWNKMPLKRTEILHLEGWLNGVMSVIPEMDREGFQRMKYLGINNGVELKYVVNLSTSVIVFPTLETFILSNMISLEEICQGNIPLTSFKNLKVLKVENCEKLRFIFSSSIARGLSLLEELNITRCNNVGAIFVKEEEDGIEDQGDMMLFCRLQTLVLKDLPKLVGFLSTIETNSEGNLHDFQLPLLHHQVHYTNQ